MRRFSWFNATSLTLGFAFLYLPMVILVIYSFNESKLVTVWAGFSTKWYGELLHNEAFLDAAWVTLQVAVSSSTLATVLGTMAAYVLVRGGRFRGRTLFSGMIYAPLVMPEVITGLSLLLLFIGIGLDRGRVHHRAGAHDLLHVLRLGRGVVAAGHLRPLARRGGARSRLLAVRGVPAGDAADHRAGRDLGLAAGLHPVARRSGDRLLHHRPLGDDAADQDLFGGAPRRLPEINALSTIMIAIVTVGVITASLITKRASVAQQRDEQAAARAA